MKPVIFYVSNISDQKSTSEGTITVNTNDGIIYYGNGTDAITIGSRPNHVHNILHDASGNIGLTLDNKSNITQLGINNQAGVPSTNPNGINVNNGTNTLVFGDSNINETLLSNQISLSVLQNDYSLTNEIAHDGKNGGVSNLVAGSCNRTDRSFSIIAGCWNVNTGNGHDSIITGLHNINGAQYSIVAGRENKVGTSNGDEAKQGGVLVVGRNNTVNGQHSVTSGANNTNNHRYSNVFGTGLSTSNNYHTVVGRYNKPLSSEIFSVGTGSSSSATRTAFMIDSGSSIHTDAKNITVKATGDVSISGNTACIGTGLQYSTSNQVVVGRYNKQSGGDCVFIVGNGTSTAPHTLLAMQSNGTSYLYGKLLVDEDLISNDNLIIKGKVTLGEDSGEQDTFLTTDGETAYWSGYKEGTGIKFNQLVKQQTYISSVYDELVSHYEEDPETLESIMVKSTAQVKFRVTSNAKTFINYDSYVIHELDCIDPSYTDGSLKVFMSNGNETVEVTIYKVAYFDANMFMMYSWPFSTKSGTVSIWTYGQNGLSTFMPDSVVNNTESPYKSIELSGITDKTFQVNAPIVAYNYLNNNIAPAVIFDKAGSYHTGIGANGEEDTILFAPVADIGKNASWVSDYTQTWKFQGHVVANTFTGDLTGNVNGNVSGNATTSGTAECAKKIVNQHSNTMVPAVVGAYQTSDGQLFLRMSYGSDIRVEHKEYIVFYVDSTAHYATNIMAWFEYNDDPRNTAGIHAEDPGYVLLGDRYLVGENSYKVNYDDEIISGHHYVTVSA